MITKLIYSIIFKLELFGMTHNSHLMIVNGLVGALFSWLSIASRGGYYAQRNYERFPVNIHFVVCNFFLLIWLFRIAPFLWFLDSGFYNNMKQNKFDK